LDKAPDAFRTISEVAEELDVPQHVLRFWESRFTQIRPMKRAGGRRYYRADDVDLLRGIRQLLYGEGYTIRGVQRILKEHGIGVVQNVWREGAAQPTRPTEDHARDNMPAPSGWREDEGEHGGGTLRNLRSRSGTELERREPRLDPPVEPLSRNLASDDLRKLQAVLHELGECRRLLNAVLG
jgi:DNA-binding transcriptional MerR regulator